MGVIKKHKRKGNEPLWGQNDLHVPQWRNDPNGNYPRQVRKGRNYLICQQSELSIGRVFHQWVIGTSRLSPNSNYIHQCPTLQHSRYRTCALPISWSTYVTKQYEAPLSRMLHDILDDDHLQWHPPLIRHFTNFWPYYWSWPYNRIWLFT